MPSVAQTIATAILVWHFILGWSALQAKPVEPARTSQEMSPSWPFLRGSQFDGRSDETGLVESFPASGPPVCWTRRLGAGYSGFTADRDRVFTQYQTLGGQYVVCLDALSGKTIWEYRYAWPYEPAGLYPGPRATPTIDGEFVYFSAPDGLVGSLRFDSGQLVWSLNLFSQFQVEPVEFGYSCSPVVVADKLLLPVGKPHASLVALDKYTGKLTWKSGNDAISHVPAMPIRFEEQHLVVAYLRNSLLLIEFESGALVSRKKLSHGYDEHAAWPIYQEPFLWLSAPFQAGSELLELTSNSQDGENDTIEMRTVWKSRLMSNDVCSSVLVDGNLYGFDLPIARRVVSSVASTWQPVKSVGAMDRAARALNLLRGARQLMQSRRIP